MSTNSIIAILENTGEVTGIYCHWDGYPEGVGATLYHHYQDLDKIRDLVSLGSISSLHENVFPTDPSHSFDNPQAGVTVAYHRDRGEDFEQIKTNISNFGNECSKYFSVVYIYLYVVDKAKWYVNGEPLENYMLEENFPKDLKESDLAKAFLAAFESPKSKMN